MSRACCSSAILADWKPARSLATIWAGGTAVLLPHHAAAVDHEQLPPVAAAGKQEEQRQAVAERA